MDVIKGKTWTFGENIDTDVIIPGRYLRTFNPQDLADHVLEGERPDFTKNVKKGDIIAKLFSNSEDNLMSAEKVAARLAYGLSRRKREMILTALGYWDVWLYKRFPRLMDKVQLYYIRKNEGTIDPGTKADR